MRTFAVKTLLVAATAFAVQTAAGINESAVFGQGENATADLSSDSGLQPARSVQDIRNTAAGSASKLTTDPRGSSSLQKETTSNRNVPSIGTRSGVRDSNRTTAIQSTDDRSSAQPSIQYRSKQLDSGLTMTDSAISSRPQTKISVDFPGGTIGEYVDVVKKEADSLNLIVTESAKELKLPKIALKNVPIHVAVKCIEQCFDPSKTIVRVGGEVEGVQFIQAEIVSTNQVEVINIRHLISGSKNDKEKENFLAAVETGLQMQSETTKNLKIKFHEETGLLFLSGDRTEISLVQQIVSELSPRFVGGMPGAMMGSSGMMGGSGGHGMGVPGMSGMPSGSMGSGGMSGSGAMLPGGGGGSMMPGGGAAGGGASRGGASSGGSGAMMNGSGGNNFGPALGGPSGSAGGGGAGISPNRTRRGSFPNSGGSGQLDPRGRSRGTVPNSKGRSFSGGSSEDSPSGGSAAGGLLSGDSAGLGSGSTGGGGAGAGSSTGRKSSKPKKTNRNSKTNSNAGGAGFPGFGEGEEVGDRAGSYQGGTADNDAAVAAEAAAAFEKGAPVGN